MLFRSCKVPPSLLILLVLLAFFTWQFSQHTNEGGDLSSQINPTAAKAPNGKPRIALMTFVTEQRSYLHLSLKNKDHYARRHGYDFIVDYESHTDRAVVFWKFDMAQRLIKEGRYDWIWWLDFDTLVMDTNIKVEDIIEEELDNATKPEEITFLLTHDCNGFNAGSMIIKSDERALQFIQASLDIHDRAQAEDIQMSEQDSTVQLLKQDPVAASRIHVVPQWKLNAFPDEIKCYQQPWGPWKPGQFILHFAGAWAHVKGDDPTGQLMQKYEGYIKWGDWKTFY